ncbi:MAG: ABC transporter ATP-binding protein [Caldilineaceae bacterium]|nr:ABC transporter ATP-binding protein [Caldilineaceae bacterium]
MGPSKRATTANRLRAASVMLRIAWQADPWCTILAFGLFTGEALAQALYAFWLKLLVDGLQAPGQGWVTLAMVGIAASIAGSTFLAYAGNRVRQVLAERAHHLIERRLIELVGRTPTLTIHETPEHLTQLELLDDAWEFGQVIPSLIDLFTTAVRIVTTALLLFNVHPLLLLLPLFGVPALLLSGKTSGLFDRGNELAAEPSRRATYLFDLATTAEAAKEVRLFRLRDAILDRFHAAHQEIRAIHQRLNVRGETIGLITRLIFLLGYLGAISFVLWRAVAGLATVGDTVLTAVLAGQVLGLIASSTNLIQFAWRTLAAAQRFVYLEDLAHATRPLVNAAALIPSRLTDGIRLDQVTYRYPLGQADVLRSLSLHLPAGATVAIVGDNGAGKTTLVKLLAGLYTPTAGRITVDGVDIATLDPEAWRQRIAAGFQDHARFEFTVRETVGLGDLTTLAAEDDQAVLAALERAGASDLVATLPQGLATQLGANWPNGIDLSGGQWQKLAIGRAMMRTTPLLLLLDEPTAALDAETEHRLFEQWTRAARQLRQSTGAVTVLVSHRFSTVQMADLIVVLSGGQIVEIGSHAALIAQGGLYAELFELQAQSYR